MLFIIGFELFGSYLIYNYVKKSLKKEAKAIIESELSDDMITTLEFSFDEVQSLYFEHSKEFQFNGMMYDIISQIKTDSSIIYTCYPDVKEQSFIKKYAERSGKGKLLSFIAGSGSLLFGFIDNFTNFNPLNIFTKRKYNPQWHFAILPRYLDVISPPPDIN